MTTTLAPAAEAPPATSGLRQVAALSASLVGTYAVTSALGMLFWLLAARQFPIAAVGVAGAAVAAMLLLGTLGTCGLGTLLISKLPLTAGGRRRVLVRTALAVAGGVTLVLAVLVPLVATAIFDIADMQSIVGTPGLAALFAIGAALTSVSIVMDQAVLVIGNGSLQLERNAFASVVKLVALLGLVAAGQSGGMSIFLAWTIGTAVSLPLVAWRTRGGRMHDESGKLLDREALRGLAGQAVSHHSLNTALQAPLQLLPLLVLIGLSAESNGVFSTSIQITGAVFALPFAIAVALFASAKGSESDILDRMRLTVPLSLAISLSANLVLFPLAGLVLSVFGSEYSSQGTEVLRVLALAGLPIVVKDHYVALRRVQGRTTEATAVMVILAAFEVVAAGVGLMSGGLVGLCAWWVGAVFVEALVLTWPLVAAVRRHRSLTVGAGAGFGPGVEAGVVRTPDAGRGRDALPWWTKPKAAAGTGTAAVTTVTRTGAMRPPATGNTPPPATWVDEDRLPAGLADGGGPDLDPEQRRRLRQLIAWVGVGPTLLLMTLGLLPIARAVTSARDSGSGSTGTDQVLYLAGLVVIFLPAALGVVLPRVATSTRVLLAVGAMVLLQLSRVVVEPSRFVEHNELIHFAGLRQIEQGGRLYGENPLLPVTSYYPGLQVATDAVRDLTGFGNHASGIVVLLTARIVLALAVLLVVSWLTRSSRVGAAAVVVYACNPQMVVFNSTFNYQTLALPLAILTVYLVLSRRRRSRLALVPPVLGLWAVIASHHLTPVLLIVAFAGWALLEAVMRRHRSRSVGVLTVMVGAGVIGLAVSLLNPGNPLLGYLGEIANSSIDAVRQVAGTGKSRRLFQNSAGVQTAPWERYAILASLAVTLVVLLMSLLRARRLLRARNSAVVVLLAVAVIFPIIPAGHLTSATAEVGDRSAGFVFVGVAFLVAWWVWQRPMRVWRSWLFGIAATVVFVGNLVLGAGSVADQLPGPFRVSDDARSIDADNLAATEWMATHLPTDSVVYGDRVGGLLAGAYGNQFSVTHVGTDVDASRLLLDPRFGAKDVGLIREAHIRYLIADRRDANGLPNQGVYIESGEYGEEGRVSPVPLSALRKFSKVPGVDAIYDNGSIVIYDLGALA